MFDEEPPGDPHDECRFEIERLQAENARLREALKFYAEPANWRRAPGGNKMALHSVALDDCESSDGGITRGGKRARAALAQRENEDA